MGISLTLKQQPWVEDEKDALRKHIHTHAHAHSHTHARTHPWGKVELIEVKETAVYHGLPCSDCVKIM